MTQPSVFTSRFPKQPVGSGRLRSQSTWSTEGRSWFLFTAYIAHAHQRRTCDGTPKGRQQQCFWHRTWKTAALTQTLQGMLNKYIQFLKKKKKYLLGFGKGLLSHLEKQKEWTSILQYKCISRGIFPGLCKKTWFWIRIIINWLY